jgi:hypothetical protein
MNRSTTLLVLAVALLGYGIYAFTFVPALLAGAPLPLLLIGFTLQCEAFILGIAPYLHALMVSIVALVITLAIAMYVSNKATVKA